VGRHWKPNKSFIDVERMLLIIMGYLLSENEKPETKIVWKMHQFLLILKYESFLVPNIISYRRNKNSCIDKFLNDACSLTNTKDSFVIGSLMFAYDFYYII
jgi:hypothetical protein